MNIHANDVNPLRAPYPELGGREAMEAIANPAVMGAAAGLPLFVGTGGVLEGKTAAQARGLLGVAPALMGNVDYYVATTGNDSNNGLSQGASLATVTAALAKIPKNLNGYAARIRIGGGSYDENIDVQGFFDGALFLSYIESANRATLNGSFNIIDCFCCINNNTTLTINCTNGASAVSTRGGNPVVRMGSGVSGMGMTIDGGGHVCISHAAGTLAIASGWAADPVILRNATFGARASARLSLTARVNVSNITTCVFEISDYVSVSSLIKGSSLPNTLYSYHGGLLVVGQSINPTA